MEIPLLASIAGIALIDSLNPTAITLQLLLLSTPRPAVRSAAFIFGVFVANYAGGLILVLGLEHFFGAQLRNIASLRAGTQLMVGVLLIIAGIVLPRLMAPHRLRRVSLQPWQSFLMGNAEMAMELPTAFPYLAAIALIIRESPSPSAVFGILLVYNILFVLPLLVLLLIHGLLPGRWMPWRAKIAKLLRRWLPRLLRVLLAGSGVFFLADLILKALGLGR